MMLLMLGLLSSCGGDNASTSESTSNSSGSTSQSTSESESTSEETSSESSEDFSSDESSSSSYLLYAEEVTDEDIGALFSSYDLSKDNFTLTLESELMMTEIDDSIDKVVTKQTHKFDNGKISINIITEAHSHEGDCLTITSSETLSYYEYAPDINGYYFYVWNIDGTFSKKELPDFTLTLEDDFLSEANIIEVVLKHGTTLFEKIGYEISLLTRTYVSSNCEVLESEDKAYMILDSYRVTINDEGSFCGYSFEGYVPYYSDKEDASRIDAPYSLESSIIDIGLTSVSLPE